MNGSESWQNAVVDGESMVPLDSVHGKNVSLRLYKVEETDMVGSMGKNIVAAKFVDSDGNESSEGILMVIKDVYVNEDVFGGEKKDMDPARRYYERWKFLRDEGLPVVPNIVVLDRNRVAMTNLVSMSRELFGKAKRQWCEYVDTRTDWGLSASEQAFLNLNLDDVIEQMKILINKLTKLGIKMSVDDPMEVEINEDGSFQILLLDLKLLERINVGDDIEKHNIDVIEYTMSNLREIKKHLSYIKSGW